MQNNIKVGERVREIRGQFHMSREKFSELIDISSVFLGQIERGERSLTIKVLNKLVDFTGYSADYILYGNDKNNSFISKINKLLNRCYDETLDYIYNLIHSTFCFFKKTERKF